MELKDRIKLLINSKNIPVAKLALDFQKTESAIRSWLLGRTKPDADTLISLAKYFGCTTDYLLGLSAHTNSDDFQASVQRTDRLTGNIGKLQREDAQNLINGLNRCIELHISDGDIVDDYTFDLLSDVIAHVSVMWMQASGMVNINKDEENKDKRTFDMPTLISFIKSQNAAVALTEQMYRSLANKVADAVEDATEHDMIMQLLYLNQATYL